MVRAEGLCVAGHPQHAHPLPLAGQTSIYRMEQLRNVCWLEMSPSRLLASGWTDVRGEAPGVSRLPLDESQKRTQLALYFAERPVTKRLENRLSVLKAFKNRAQLALCFATFA